jgi:ankyrin repeat protein
MILDVNANVNAKSVFDRGQTALQATTKSGYLDIVNQLLDVKADVNAKLTETGG